MRHAFTAPEGAQSDGLARGHNYLFGVPAAMTTPIPRELRSVSLNRPVGSTYEYANAGYMMLGLLIQQVSGQTFEAYIHEHIFAPLQRGQTFTDWTEARAHGAATGHRYWFGICAGDGVWRARR